MVGLADVKRLARTMRATVEQERIGDTVTLEVIAPQGMRWAEQLHIFTDCAYVPWKPDYADMMQRMRSYGLEKCDDPDCDWCNSDEA